jgi:DNA-binding NarL/FixJ family response regulator
MPHHLSTALIVDDNSYIRRALCSFIESHTVIDGCSEAADGLEAVEKSKQQKPVLVLLDLSMPNMNGVEAAGIIRKLLPNARIVVFTIHSTVKSLVGADVVVCKEEGSAGLLAALHSLFPDSFFQVSSVPN